MTSTWHYGVVLRRKGEYYVIFTVEFSVTSHCMNSTHLMNL